MQPITTTIQITIQLTNTTHKHLLNNKKQTKQTFIQNKLNNTLKPKLTLNILNQLPKLIQHQNTNTKTKKNITNTTQTTTIKTYYHQTNPNKHPRLQTQHTSTPDPKNNP